MTDTELREFVEKLFALQAETTKQMQETDRRMKETDRQMQETDQKMQETDRKMQETGRIMQETDRKLQESARQIKELGKQIGGLGEKFGSFTEGLALPSMTKILSERFGMEVVSPSVRVKKQGEAMEIDVLAYANSDINEAYVVEVKSHAREESISQLQTILERFRRFFPEHKDKTVYGILAAIDVSDELRERILKAGFYVARIHDQLFDLDVPANFKPKAY
jgi:hypothetical protein